MVTPLLGVKEESFRGQLIGGPGFDYCRAVDSPSMNSSDPVTKEDLLQGRTKAAHTISLGFPRHPKGYMLSATFLDFLVL